MKYSQPVLSTEQDFIEKAFLERYQRLLGLEIELKDEYTREFLSLMSKLEDDVRELVLRRR